MVYSEWVRRKQDEALSWQINKKDDDDGGFCAEKPNVVGGVWTTSEFLFTFMKFKLLPRGIIVFKGLKIGLSVTKT